MSTKQDVNQVIKAVYDEDEKRLRVDSKITASIAELEVIIDAESGDNISISSADGNNSMNVNPDGSIDANVKVDALDGDSILIKDSDGNELKVNPNGTIGVTFVERHPVNIFREVPALAVGAEATVYTVNLPAGSILSSIEVGGNNVGQFEVTLAGEVIARKYLSYTNYESHIDFQAGLAIDTVKQLTIKATNESTTIGSFYTRVLIK